MWVQRWNNKTSSWNVVHWELTGLLLELFFPLLNEVNELEKIRAEKRPTFRGTKAAYVPSAGGPTPAADVQTQDSFVLGREEEEEQDETLAYSLLSF